MYSLRNQTNPAESGTPAPPFFPFSISAVRRANGIQSDKTKTHRILILEFFGETAEAKRKQIRTQPSSVIPDVAISYDQFKK